MKSLTVSAVRASISFPADLYESLEVLAKRKKVSLAWVVRDAAEKYVTGEGADGAGLAPSEVSARPKAGRNGRPKDA
jgi:predicted transcriptional regulator